MATRTPYIRLEKPDGSPILEQRVFDGVLGSTWPGHRSAAAQILRLLTERDELPPDGVLIRSAAAADATGRQQSVAYLMDLPSDFNVTAGWKYWLDSDHIHVAGPVEATWNKDGEMLYAGRAIEPGKLAFELNSSPSEGILGRIRKENRYYAECVRFQERNHYFLEGEPVTFRVDCGAGIDAPLDTPLSWLVFDGYRRPMPLRGTVDLRAPESSLWPRADRKMTWRTAWNCAKIT